MIRWVYSTLALPIQWSIETNAITRQTIYTWLFSHFFTLFHCTHTHTYTVQVKHSFLSMNLSFTLTAKCGTREKEKMQATALSLSLPHTHTLAYESLIVRGLRNSIHSQHDGWSYVLLYLLSTCKWYNIFLWMLKKRERMGGGGGSIGWEDRKNKCLSLHPVDQIQIVVLMCRWLRSSNKRATVEETACVNVQWIARRPISWYRCTGVTVCGCAAE